MVEYENTQVVQDLFRNIEYFRFIRKKHSISIKHLITEDSNNKLLSSNNLFCLKQLCLFYLYLYIIYHLYK